MSKNLRELAIDASTRSHSPYSKAKVGAALMTTDGQVFQGCNVENASFGGTVCAERVAIWKAVSEGAQDFKKIYVYHVDGWPPCAICLQIMTEFCNTDFEVTYGDKNGKEQTRKLSELLPHAFTPDHLR